jgi:class 3 adenylate cyclase
MMAKVVAVKWVSDIVHSEMTARPELERFIDVMMSLDDRIACIVISGSQGNIIAGDLNTKWIEFSGDKITALSSLIDKELKHNGFKSVSVNIETEGSVGGNIKIIFSLSPLKKKVLVSLVTWLGIGSGFILMGIIGAFFISKKITRPLSTIADAMSNVESGDLTQKVDIRTSDEVGTMGRAFNKMVDGLNEREFIKDTFSKYVSKQVADKILKEKDYLKLKGEKRVVTVLFADIRGFTPLAETIPPEKVIDILNQYFSMMIDVVFQYGGVLNKFIGDAIMVTYNAPLDQKYHELRAVLTGLEIQKKMAEMNKKRLERGEQQINIGIGINTDEAVAGNVGSPERLEYTVIGSGVNIAQRIESSTEKGQLHISEKTYEAVKDYVEVIKLNLVRVKGISEPVQLYSVINAKIPEDFHENH